jgi:hypothetical protein
VCLGIVESNGDIDDDDGERDDDGAEENGKDERRRTTGGWTRTVARARGTREERRKGAQSETKRPRIPTMISSRFTTKRLVETKTRANVHDVKQRVNSNGTVLTEWFTIDRRLSRAPCLTR